MEVYPNFCLANVLVVGDIILDRYWYGNTKGVSSDVPSVPVMQIHHMKEYPGGAANVAMNIAALGAKSKLIGLVGMDNFAQNLKEKLTEACVECEFISVTNYSTVNKLRIMSHDRQVLRLDFERNFNRKDASSILKCVKYALLKFDVLVLSDYSKGSLIFIEDIISLARSFDIPILVDPKGSDFSRYRGATILTPNISEFEAVVDHCNDEKVLIRRGIEIITEYEISALLITRAEKGMTLLRLGSDPLHFPAQGKVVYDVIGAGDTVIAVLAAALSSGSKIEDSCALANAAAGIVIGKIGTSTVSAIELSRVFI